MAEQLANFYIRQKEFKQALDTLSKALNPSSPESTRIQALFLSKVIQPIQMDTPSSIEDEYLRYLSQLPAAQFWDPTTFSQLEHSQALLKTDPSTYWLKVLDRLKRGNEQDALVLLENSPLEEVSLSPDLEKGLRRIIQYRTLGSLLLPEENFGEGTSVSSIPFFADLYRLGQEEKLKGASDVPLATHDLLTGPEAYAALFLAAGWNEAALQFHHFDILPSSYPEWFVTGLTAAYKQNRGLEPALQFAKRQSKNDALTVQIAKLDIEKKDYNTAIEELTPLLTQESDPALQARLLLTLIYSEKRDYPAAIETLTASPALAQSTKGQELLARLNLKAGKEEEAASIYQAIEQDSKEAKSYLAKKAFRDQDFPRAYELTQELLKAHPHSQVLQKNLAKLSALINKS